MGRFTNKIVVITGGTSGIGLATAGQFIKEGATVVVIGRSPRSVGDAQKEIGANGVAIAADVTKSAELDAVIQTVREKYGRIDVLYANAGIAKLGSVAETTEEVFDDIVNANFRAAYFTVQKALPLLSDSGAIVFTTSWFDQTGVAGTSAVSASNAALRNFTRTLASELIGRKSASTPSAPARSRRPFSTSSAFPRPTPRSSRRPCFNRFRRSGSASRKKSRWRWHSLPPTMPPILQALNSPSTAAALNYNRRHQGGAPTLRGFARCTRSCTMLWAPRCYSSTSPCTRNTTPK